MKSIFYITANKYKLLHAKEYVRDSGIEIVGRELEIFEIQSDDLEQVVRKKAYDAWHMLQQPLIVSDSGWEIPALGGFPGPYMKDINNWFKPEDFLNLMKDKPNRSIYLNHMVVVVIAGRFKIFREKSRGEFVGQPKGAGSALDRVVMMDGCDMTIAENQEQGMFSADKSDLWKDIIEYLHDNWRV